MSYLNVNIFAVQLFDIIEKKIFGRFFKQRNQLILG